MDDKTLLQRMKKGNKSAILEGLRHPGALFRINGIINVERYGLKDEEIIDYILDLKCDKISFDGYSVSDFAISALDLLDLEKYNGNDVAIKQLIESKFEF